MEQPDLLSVEQVAALLGCCSRSVLRYVELGRLPRPEKFGRLARWHRRDILAALA